VVETGGQPKGGHAVLHSQSLRARPPAPAVPPTREIIVPVCRERSGIS
jgi:hypothetical protein